VIWGEKDPFLGKELARPPSSWVVDARVELLPNASHSVQLDEPERVSASLAQFLA
jgi:pimeloyl-ACP methyl ester carboxylesterase